MAQSAEIRRKKTGVVPTQSSTSLTNLIGTETSNTPIGIRLFGICFKFKSQQTKRNYHKALVLLLTFIAYAAFHMGRRPLSVVKNVLNHDHSKQNSSLPSNNGSKDTSPDWAPFDDAHLLTWLDTAWLSSYAIFMFISGIIAERMNLRYFISIGCILCGLSLVAFGLAYPLDIHFMSYFVIAQIASGAFHTTGWPVVVTCISNWFEESKRGTIYGLWNSHTSLGNILGVAIAGVFVERNWGLSFTVPGAIMVAVGIILFLFLVPAPKDVELSSPNNDRDCLEIARKNTSHSEVSVHSYDLEIKSTKDPKGSMSICDSQEEQKAVSFLRALKIPGVIEYSFCLFFSKLVSYTFLIWLPRYISASTESNSEDSAYLSIPFDVGGIGGAILAGYLSDKLKVNGIICNVMLILAIPSMYIYQVFGSYSSMHNVLLQLVVGALVNGPYCLITTAVSADLSNRIKDGHAMATVSSIIDGMGSVGAVVGPTLAGFVSSNNWTAVFLILMVADVLASLCIIRVTIQDIKKTFFKSNDSPIDQVNS